jgi:ankyrin repeat protein
VWVRIWLDILLPHLNPLHIITGRKRAEELLKEMRETSLPAAQRDKQLQTAYQRLWERNENPSLIKTRTHLFRLVLCSFSNHGIAELTQALQVSSGDDDLDHEAITEAIVRRLGDNFLEEDSTGNVIFVHDSAKAFISKMKDKNVEGPDQINALIFEAKRNHLYVAELYITVASLPEHPLWQKSGIDFSMRAAPNEEARRIAATDTDLPLSTWLDTTQRDGNQFLSYIASKGLWHCQLAAKKTSIFDAVWKNVFDKVIRPNNLAFLVCAAKFLVFFTPLLFTFEGNHFEPIYASMIAFLDILCYEDFPDAELGNLSKSPSNWSDRERRLALLLQAASATSHVIRSQSNALCVACYHDKEVTVQFLLSGTYHLRGPQVVLDLLNTTGKVNQKTFVIFEAIQHVKRRDNGTIVEMLLKFEVQSMSQIAEETHDGDPPKQQWCLYENGFPALISALYFLEEDTVCHLIDICPPHHIDLQDEWGGTPLHVAAERGYLRLVQKFVTEFRASTEIMDVWGKIALDYARQERRHACIEYLESVEPSESYLSVRRLFSQ